MSMRSAPGAALSFVWTVNNREPAIPFNEYYPGDDVVNVVGDDVYDEVMLQGSGWTWSDGGAEGVAGLVSFADAHGKPIAFPEWGTGIVTSSNPSGDDPGFMAGMENVIATQNVAFQSYFWAHQYKTQLMDAPQSLSLYRSAFGTLANAPIHVPSASAPTTTTKETTTEANTGSTTTKPRKKTSKSRKKTSKSRKKTTNSRKKTTNSRKKTSKRRETVHASRSKAAVSSERARGAVPAGALRSE